MTGRAVTGRAVLALFLALGAAALIPVFSVTLPPLFDYPNHVGRMAILAAGGSDPILNRFYTIDWAPLPNLAMDAVVPPLARGLGVVAASRLFLAATLISLAAGIVSLHRAASGRWQAWPLLGFLILYNRILLWGFVNYLAGLGLALCAAAAWLALDRRAYARAGFGIAAGLAVFFAHIEAAAVLALMLAGIEAPRVVWSLRQRDWRGLASRAIPLASALLPPALAFAAWRAERGAGPAGNGFHWANPWRKLDLLFSVFDDYARPFDVACFVLCLGAFAWGLARGRIEFLPRLKGAIAAVGLAYLAAPSVAFSGTGADHRLPLVLAALLIAGTAPGARNPDQLRMVGAGLLGLFALRLAFVEQAWLAADHSYRADLAVLDRLPRGTRLAVAAEPGGLHAGAAPEFHLPVLAVARREAFVPTLFHFAGQQPVGLTPTAAALAAAADPGLLWRGLFTESQGQRAAAERALAGYDDLVAVAADRPASHADRSRSRCLVWLGGSRSFDIYRVAERCQARSELGRTGE